MKIARKWMLILGIVAGVVGGCSQKEEPAPVPPVAQNNQDPYQIAPYESQFGQWEAEDGRLRMVIRGTEQVKETGNIEIEVTKIVEEPSYQLSKWRATAILDQGSAGFAFQDEQHGFGGIGGVDIKKDEIALTITLMKGAKWGKQFFEKETYTLRPAKGFPTKPEYSFLLPLKQTLTYKNHETGETLVVTGKEATNGQILTTVINQKETYLQYKTLTPEGYFTVFEGEEEAEVLFPATVGRTWKVSGGKRTIQAVNQTVTTPAGSFTRVVQVQNEEGKLLSYAPEVGLIQVKQGEKVLVELVSIQETKEGN